MNGNGGLVPNFGLLLATGAHENLLVHNSLVFGFLSQYHPHDKFRIWLPTFLKPNFVSHQGHFITSVHAEVVHPLVNKIDESRIFYGYEKLPYDCFELLRENDKTLITIVYHALRRGVLTSSELA